MDPRLQAKLLRAIQEREIDRVGGSRPVKVDIRLIATSNRDLQEAVADGQFREDLYFRLNVLVDLHLPPLRERRADIEPLASFFVASTRARQRPAALRRSSRRPGAAARPMPGAAMSASSRTACTGRCCWPRATRSAPTMIVLGGRLEAPTPGAAACPGSRRGGDRRTLVGRSRRRGRARSDHRHARPHLGNRTHAATILGISIRTLRNKLKQYGDAGVPVPAPAGGSS